jgi:hypothetical protein
MSDNRFVRVPGYMGENDSPKPPLRLSGPNVGGAAVVLGERLSPPHEARISVPIFQTARMGLRLCWRKEFAPRDLIPVQRAATRLHLS